MGSLTLRVQASPSVHALRASAQMQNPGYFSSIEYALLRLPSAIMVFTAQLCVLFRSMRSGRAQSLNWAYGAISFFAPIFLDKGIERIDEKTRTMERQHQRYHRDDWKGMLRAPPKEMIIHGAYPLIMRSAEAELQERLYDASRGEALLVAMQVGRNIARRMTDKILEVSFGSKSPDQP